MNVKKICGVVKVNKRRYSLVILALVLVGCVIISQLSDSDDPILDALELEEYAVYSTIIGERFHAPVIVIVDHTSSGRFFGEELSTQLNHMHEKMPTAEKETFLYFRAKNEQSHSLNDSFDCNAIIKLLSEEKVREIFRGTFGWSEFYVRYPFSQGIMTLSRVGFNSEMNQALVYYGNSKGSLSGAGYYLLLTRINGVWVVQDEILVWIS